MGEDSHSHSVGMVKMRSSRDYEIPASSGINEKEEVANGRLEKRVIDFEKVEQEVGSL